MPPFSAEQAIHLHKGLLLVRQTELRLATLYKEQEIRTPTHFGVGQEAIAVGVCSALNVDDVVYSHHRCHNHYLAKGGSLDGLVAELYGRETGCSRGRGGSVHLTDRSAGVIATSAILGQSVAVATGSAMAFAMDGQPRVAVAFFGDAVPEEGIFYESLNMAAIHRLPVLYVCENNGLSTESLPTGRQPAGAGLCERVRAFTIEAESVDGNDVEAVARAALAAVDACRAGRGPRFIECSTHRWLEHVGPYFDYELGRAFRSREEIEAGMLDCPVARSARRLTEAGIATAEDMAAWERAIEERLDRVVATAKAAPWPAAATLFDNVH